MRTVDKAIVLINGDEIKHFENAEEFKDVLWDIVLNNSESHFRCEEDNTTITITCL